MTEEKTPTIIEGVEVRPETSRLVSARHGEQRLPTRDWILGRAVKPAQPEESEVANGLGK